MRYVDSDGDAALDGLSDSSAKTFRSAPNLYWSLLDNFEWTSGFSEHFDLVSVDLQTFARTIKPSALHLGAIARADPI